mgnify:CR=1 FL=1
MVVSYQAIHIPYQVPGKYLKPYQNVNTPEHPERNKVAGMWHVSPDFIHLLLLKTFIKKACLILAMTACMDESMKDITDFFKENGLWNNTLTIFSTGIT